MADRLGTTRQSRFFPGDLVLVALLGLWTIAIAWEATVQTGRMALGLVAVLFVPGYALVAALFPRSKSSAGIFDWIENSPDSGEGTVTVVERLVLAVGLSVCVVPLIGMGIHYSPWEIRSSVFLGAIGATTVILAIVATVRRLRVPAKERFDPRIVGAIFDGVGRIPAVWARSSLTLVLIVGLVVAAGGIGFAVVDTERGERFTEFYITTEDPETGEAVAGEYPEEIVQGDSGSVQLGITNNEREPMDYTVVVVLQSAEEDGEMRTVETLDRFTVTVPDGETFEETHTIRPEETGEDLRVTYLLYTGSPPEDATLGIDNAYRHVHFWIDVLPSD